MKHGGDIGEAGLGDIARDGDWLDLSTGIAPVPYPLPTIPSPAWQKLPQSAALARLLTVAREAYAAHDSAAIVAAPGTQILIQLLPLLLPERRVCILGPTYSEHAICWRRTARRVDTVSQPDELLQAEIAIVTNPNNPDGRQIEPDRIVSMAHTLASRGNLMIVDEAFADAVPETSVAAHLGGPGLLILRSFGKFYGLAGVRLGFALGHSEIIERLSSLLGPWAVPGPAIEIGTTALADVGWASRSRARYHRQAAQLDTVLRDAGLDVIGGAPLFRLASHPQASEIHCKLARDRLLTRRFNEHPNWLRFGLPGEGNLIRLVSALQRAVAEAAPA